MQETLNLALWQTPYLGTPAESLARLDAIAAQAQAQGADLLLCPETGLTGYAIGPDRAATLAERADGPLAQAVGAIAQHHGIAIVYGYPERHSNSGKPFNAAQAIGPHGESLGHYRKTHLYGELDHAQFSAGSAASQVFEWRGWRLGLLICYDVEFPETVRGLALQGADAVLVPTANMVGFDEVSTLLVPARACENRLYLAYANACGSEGDTHYNGLSTAADARGAVLAQAGRGEALMLVPLKRSALLTARQHSYLSARRPDLYRPLTD
jgi:predicted amidohydrolase